MPKPLQSKSPPKKPVLDNTRMAKILELLDARYITHPMGDLAAGNPYKVLVACVMSLRTKDDMTIPLARKLFELADTPDKMVRFSQAQLETLIYPVGFYKTKAKNILAFSRIILDKYAGQVPDTMDALLTLPNVGRKTANLVMGLGYGKPAVCVDIHVHRICQRMGYLVGCKTPDDTEAALREKLPPQYWHVINRVMVMHGQQVCKPVSPHCDVCPVANLCAQVDVKPRKVLR